MKLSHNYLFDHNIIIETPRLMINTLEISEDILLDLYEIYSDIENCKGFCIPHIHGYDAFKDYMIRKYDKYFLNERRVYMFTITEKESKKVIGIRNMIFDSKYQPNGRLFINYLNNIITETAINKLFWRKGYAFESTYAIFECMENFDFKYILSFITPENEPAIKHIEKLGFEESNKIEIIEKYGFYREALSHTFNSEIDKIYILKNT